MITKNVASRLYFSFLAINAATRPIDKKVAVAEALGGTRMAHAFGVGNTPFHVELVVWETLRAQVTRPAYNASNNNVQRAYDSKVIDALEAAIANI